MIFWDSLRFFEILGRCFEILWDSWKILWDSMRLVNDILRFFEILWDSWKYFEMLWDSWRFLEIPAGWTEGICPAEPSSGAHCWRLMSLDKTNQINEGHQVQRSLVVTSASVVNEFILFSLPPSLPPPPTPTPYHPPDNEDINIFTYNWDWGWIHCGSPFRSSWLAGGCGGRGWEG